LGGHGHGYRFDQSAGAGLANGGPL
jgi:hypothetical protein